MDAVWNLSNDLSCGIEQGCLVFLRVLKDRRVFLAESRDHLLEVVSKNDLPKRTDLTPLSCSTSNWYDSDQESGVLSTQSPPLRQMKYIVAPSPSPPKTLVKKMLSPTEYLHVILKSICFQSSKC